MGVFACETCGLLQSLSLAPVTPERRVSLSCDADWGNVRHGKGVRFAALKPMIEGLDWGKIGRVADIGSSRGDFALWVEREHPGTEIYAIEPDTLVTAAYDQRPGITTLHQRFENVALPMCDLIYCVHTLEHADSAREMLLKCRESLRPGGRMLLEVPNLNFIANPHNVEEFFIDKHCFHFGPYMLTALVDMLGFAIVGRRIDSGNVTFELLKPLSDRSHPFTWTRSGAAQMIAPYAATLASNRAKLRCLVDNDLRPMARQRRVAYWGAGRVFAALRQYGGLKPEDVFRVVDGHLAKILEEKFLGRTRPGSVAGFPIEEPSTFAYSKPDVLVIAALGAATAIEEAARAREYGTPQILRFGDLMEQEV